MEALRRQNSAIFNAFTEAMANIHNGADIRRLEQAIEAGDVDGAMRALNLSPAAMDGMREAIRNAFLAGATYQVALAPKPLVAGLSAEFQGYHPRVIEWIERNAGGMVAETVAEQRRVIRQTIATGFEQRRGYKAIALDLVGRMDGNSRKGGVVGLLSREADYVANLRDALSGADVGKTSTGQTKFWIKEDGTLGSTYKLRDGRFDRTIAKAIREGRPIPADVLENAAARYGARLLRERGRRISRTEGNRAMNEGRAEAVRQMIDRGDAAAADITKEWRHTRKPGQRDNHAAINRQARAWGERFDNGLLWPHEEGAPASEVVNCACFIHTRTDWVAVARRRGTF